MDISNKNLAWLLVAVIAVSFGTTLYSVDKLGDLGFTGMAATDTGETNFSINTTITITFTTAAIDFGAGYANDSSASTEYCTLDTNGTNPSGDCQGFNSGLSPFVIKNDGTVDVKLTLQSNATPAEFVGGTTPVFQWFLANVNTGDCSSGLNPTQWATVNSSSAHTVCPAANFQAITNDELNLHVKVSIPEDASAGEHTATITATGSQV